MNNMENEIFQLNNKIDDLEVQIDEVIRFLNWGI